MYLGNFTGITSQARVKNLLNEVLKHSVPGMESLPGFGSALKFEVLKPNWPYRLITVSLSLSRTVRSPLAYFYKFM